MSINVHLFHCSSCQAVTVLMWLFSSSIDVYPMKALKNPFSKEHLIVSRRNKRDYSTSTGANAPDYWLKQSE